MNTELIVQITSLVLLGAILIGGLVWFLRSRSNAKRSLDFVFLQVQLPKKDSKEDMERERDQTSEIRKVISVAEDFFGALYGIFSSDISTLWTGQDFFSCEYIAMEGEIYFYVGCPRDLRDLVDKQITSFYPDAVVDDVQAPKLFHAGTKQATGYLTADKSCAYPFKTYQKFENTDAINNLLNALSNASDENGNTAVVQFMVRPHASNWQKKARDKSRELSEGKKKRAWWNPLGYVGGFFEMLVRGADENSSGNKDDGAKENESQDLTKMMEEKAEKVGFETIIRCATSSPNQKIAQSNLTNIMNVFTQFGTPSLNSFSAQKWHSQRGLIKNILYRNFARSWHVQNKIILSTEEIGSMFHFPHVKYNNVPAVKWQRFKVVKAPHNIPKKGLHLGKNTYRGVETQIYMNHEDRFRHFYVIGQTGTGKSSIFQQMIRQDFQNGMGVCVVDPHGSLIEDLLPHVPKDRVDDVIIFDPSDTERPLGINLLEAESEEEMDMVALDAMNIMLKIFDEETFGPRIQDYFRNGVLTLMSDPEGGAITDVMRLFTDDGFQKAKVKHVTNPVVKSFWTNQMAKTGAREKGEIIPYFAAKFGQFVTNGLMRNIIGQTKSSFDFSAAMNGQKILLMNLSKGTTGDINSKLLGLIITSKIQIAAMRRQKMKKEERKDFFMYIDEFQNYVSDSIESILSEARKYRLGLCMAHQYISQIDQSGKKGGVNLKDAVFGNVGTIMCYKIGAQDTEIMSKEFAPTFTDQDLVNIDAFKACIKLAVDGQPSAPFTLEVPRPWLTPGNVKMGEALKQISRLTFGRSKKFVEKEIFARLDV
ncbi:MAG TPA: type IV secretion system DNA-binding domain-containing protein [Candidatus Gracilibacteria bacterium]